MHEQYRRVVPVSGVATYCCCDQLVQALHDLNLRRGRPQRAELGRPRWGLFQTGEPIGDAATAFGKASPLRRVRADLRI